MLSKWWKPGKYERITDELEEIVSDFDGSGITKTSKNLTCSAYFGRFNIQVKGIYLNKPARFRNIGK